MIPISAVGRTTADIEVKESIKKALYVSFDLAVNKGYGEGKHTVYLQCWAFGNMAQRLESANVKKGSQLMIAGDLDVVDFERKDGSKGKANKVYLWEWQFVGSDKSSEKNAKPEKTEENVEYQEHFCGDDEDLPL